MSKGFVIPRAIDNRVNPTRKERDKIVKHRNVRPDLSKGETNEAFAWAVANKPGTVPVGGGRKQRMAAALKTRYDRFINEAVDRGQKINYRYTPPRQRLERQRAERRSRHQPATERIVQRMSNPKWHWCSACLCTVKDGQVGQHLDLVHNGVNDPRTQKEDA